MTVHELSDAPQAESEIPDTEVIPVPEPDRVFVDTTGRRRQLLRRAAYAVGGFCMVYGGLVTVSLAGGPVSPSAVLPIPDLIERREDDGAPRPPVPVPTPAIDVSRGQARADLAPDRRVPRSTVRAGNTPVTTPAPRPTEGAIAPGPPPRRPTVESRTSPSGRPGTTPTAVNPSRAPSSVPSSSASPSGSAGPGDGNPDEGNPEDGDKTADDLVPVAAGPARSAWPRTAGPEFSA